MEKIPFNVDEVTAEVPGEQPFARRARLEGAVQQAVMVHRANLSEYTPASVPRVGFDADIDAGRQTIWRLDGEILGLDIRGWH